MNNDFYKHMLLTRTALIADPLIRNFTEIAIDRVNIWEKPTAFRAGNHPHIEMVEGGMTYHTLHVAIICEILCDGEDIQGFLHDCIQSAAFIHDIGKFNEDGPRDPYAIKDGDMCGTNHDHPYLVRHMVPLDIIPTDTLELILGMVESHMGRWGKYPCDTRAKTILHYADMISARYDP